MDRDNFILMISAIIKSLQNQVFVFLPPVFKRHAVQRILFMEIQLKNKRLFTLHLAYFISVSFPFPRQNE